LYYPDLPISVAFGAILTATGLPAGKTPDFDRISRRSLWQVLIYGLFFHCPDSTFAFIWYPDWNLGYYFPFAKVGGAGVVFLELLLLGLLFSGRWLALKAARKKAGLVWLPILTMFLVFGAVMFLVFDRYIHSGSYETYRAGLAPLASADPVFQMFTTLAGFYLLTPFVLMNLYNILIHRYGVGRVKKRS